MSAESQSFVAYLVGMAAFPRRYTERWLQDGRRLRMAAIAWLIISVLYGSATLIGGLNGLGAVTAPFLPIPAAEYYVWEGPLTPVIFLIIFIVLAGWIQLESRLVGGTGAFEDTFVSVVFSFWTPMIVTMWLFEMPVLVFFPDVRSSALGGLGYLPGWLDSTRQAAGMVWIVIVLALSTKIVQKISLPKAVLLTIIAMIPTTAVMLTYVR